MKTILMALAILATAATTCLAAESPAPVFRGVSESGVTILIEVRTPVPATKGLALNRGKYTSEVKKFCLSEVVDGTNFYAKNQDKENITKAQEFFEDLFAKNKFTVGTYDSGGKRQKIFIKRDGKDVALDELFAQWLIDQGIDKRKAPLPSLTIKTVDGVLEQVTSDGIIVACREIKYDPPLGQDQAALESYKRQYDLQEKIRAHGRIMLRGYSTQVGLVKGAQIKVEAREQGIIDEYKIGDNVVSESLKLYVVKTADKS